MSNRSLSVSALSNYINVGLIRLVALGSVSALCNVTPRFALFKSNNAEKLWSVHSVTPSMNSPTSCGPPVDTWMDGSLKLTWCISDKLLRVRVGASPIKVLFDLQDGHGDLSTMRCFLWFYIIFSLTYWLSKKLIFFNFTRKIFILS